MKTLVTDYTFNAAAGTIKFNDYTIISLEGLLLITNTTDNIIIYNFADPSTGATVSGNIVDLGYDTSSMSNTDSLQIYYDDGRYDQQINYEPAIKSLTQVMANPPNLDKSTNRARQTTVIESGTVTTVTTVSTVTGITNFGGMPGQVLVNGQFLSAWSQCVRSKIT